MDRTGSVTHRLRLYLSDRKNTKKERLGSALFFGNGRLEGLDDREDTGQSLDVDVHGRGHTQSIRTMAAFRVAAVAAFQVVDGREDDFFAFFVEVDALHQLVELGHCFGQTRDLTCEGAS